MMSSTRPTFHRRSAAAVELAIVAPFLLLILFAIIELGWMMAVRQMVHHAASDFMEY